MAIHVAQQDTTPTITTVCRSPVAGPASATAKFYSPSGTLVASAAATVPSTSVTLLLSGDDDGSYTQFTVQGSTAGVAAGQWYRVRNDESGHYQFLRFAIANGSAITLDEPLGQYDPGNGSISVTPTYMSVAVPSAVTATRGVGYRVDWVVTLNSSLGVETYSDLLDVTRSQVANPVDIDMVRLYLTSNFPSYLSRSEWTDRERIAQRASDRVWREVRKDGRYPHLVISPYAFAEPGFYALRYVLADEGLLPPGVPDTREYQRDQDLGMVREVGSVIASGWYDGNDLGDTATATRGPSSIRIVR